MPLTLISHFWNEEFLLPYWLRHHYPLFDHGVLLDYASTDQSVEIIRALAPRWEVRPSRNQWFDARDADAEVMEVEREFAEARADFQLWKRLHAANDDDDRAERGADRCSNQKEPRMAPGRF